MLLTLIKKQTTRRGIRAVLIEKNHLFGDKRLAEVYIPPDDDMPDLIYPVTITLSGIHLRGHRVRWLWKAPGNDGQLRATCALSNPHERKYGWS
jgi:hypothetical protein